MPILSVTFTQGRSDEKKRALVRNLTETVVKTFDVRPEQVRIVLNEVPPEHFSVAGVTFAEKQEQSAVTRAT